MATSYPMSFELTELTAALIDRPYKPAMLGEAGLFAYKGIRGTTFHIERRGNTLELVPTKPRGAPGTPIGRGTRSLRPFDTVHVPLDDAIYADEVRGERLFGTENEPTDFQTRLMEVMDLGRQRLEYTLEWHRVGCLKGQVLDADGTTVLLDMFEEFGVTQQTQDFALGSDSTKLRTICDDVRDMISDELGGIPFNGVEAYVGKVFWKKFIEHKAIRETYLSTVDARDLRGGLPDSFNFGDITWRRYRGKGAGNLPMIGDNDCYISPTGVPDLFLGRFGAPDIVGEADAVGLPMYAHGELMPNRKGWNVWMQSNPFHVCTRPRAVIKGFTA